MALLKGMRRKPPGTGDKKGIQNLSRKQSSGGSGPEGSSGCDLATDVDTGHQQDKQAKAEPPVEIRLRGLY